MGSELGVPGATALRSAGRLRASALNVPLIPEPDAALGRRPLRAGRARKQAAAKSSCLT